MIKGASWMVLILLLSIGKCTGVIISTCPSSPLPPKKPQNKYIKATPTSTAYKIINTFSNTVVCVFALQNTIWLFTFSL